MGLTYAQIKDRPRKLLALTDLTRSEFADLLAAFNKVSQPGRPRQHQAGGRTVALHSNEDRLLFILVYLKTYPLSEITGALFGMKVSKVNEWRHRLLPVICDALDELGAMPERDARAGAPTRGRQRTRRTALLDGAPRRRQRAKRADKQAAYYEVRKQVPASKNLGIAARLTRNPPLGYDRANEILIGGSVS